MWWIVAAFLAVQIYVIWCAANGPFVDEGLYIVAGMRVLEGQGPSDGYITWFNGSPFVWPVIAAVGHRFGGLPGARFMAAILSTVTLVAFARTAENLFGQLVAEWCALAFAVNGLFMALAHFAVYDVAALAGKMRAWAVFVLLLLARSSVGSEGECSPRDSRCFRDFSGCTVPDVLPGERVLVMGRGRVDDLLSDLHRRLLQAEARLRASEGLAYGSPAHGLPMVVT